MEATDSNGRLSAVRKEFFAFRNGLLADTLRKGGLEQKYIFGLQLPQIKDIAERFRPSEPSDAAAMARDLWSDRECRESRLLACHIMPSEQLSKEEASEWIKDIRNREEADIIAFRLLRYLPDAADLAESMKSDENDLMRYAATAIHRFL